MYADYQIVKKEVNPAWGRPPFLYYKDNTILSEMQIAFLGGLVEICEKSLQMRVGEIALWGEYDVLLFFLLSEKRIRTHELCVRTYQVEIRHDFLFFCASVLDQNKDALRASLLDKCISPQLAVVLCTLFFHFRPLC